MENCLNNTLLLCLLSSEEEADIRRVRRPHIPERKLLETNLKVLKTDNLTAGPGNDGFLHRQEILSSVSLMPSKRRFHLRTILHNVAVFETLRGLFSELNAMFPDCVLVDS
ncbi:hypothetical protein J6590_078523 [Homalodisca vitripennis]|nr:hypothetical protein J6590_078523 [Homalodisca vitripennis]